MLNLEDYISRLDTQRFGFKVARVEFHSEDEVSEIVSYLNEQGFVLIITKVNCKDIHLINQLEESGFRTMDFQLAYDYYGSKSKENQVDQSVYPVREIERSDVPQLIQIAQDSFTGFGHYCADKRLPQDTCLEIYKDWTRNVCTIKDFADVVFAAYDVSTPIGFFAFKKIKASNAGESTGVIGAVSAKYEGKNAFQSLILKGIEWSASKNLRLTDCRVHSTNYPVNRAFAKLGFRIVSSYITMHHWNDTTS